MKRLWVVIMLLVFAIGIIDAGAAAQNDPCSRDAVIASFNAAVKSGKKMDLWAQNYTESKCPANIKNAVRMMASAYILMGSETIQFAAPDDPSVLNPVLQWQPGGSTANIYDLTMEADALTLIAGPGTDQGQNRDSAPLVVYPFEGNFDAQVKVVFKPSGGYWKLAGLGVRSREDHITWLRIGKVLGAGGGQEMMTHANPKGSLSNLSGVPYSNDIVYLKIERKGPLFALFYSENGSNWTATQQDYVFEMPDQIEIYLTAFSTNNEGTVARFYDFSVTGK